MANISITPAHVTQGESAIRDSGIAGEAIQPGEVVYRDATTGRWMKASHVAEAENGRTPEGFALNGAAADQPLAAQTLGPLMVGAVLQSGGTYYLSDTPGKICLAADLELDEFISIVGMARSSVMLDVKILSAQVRDSGEGGFYTDDLGRPVASYTDDLGRPLSFFTDDLGRRL